MLMYILRNKTQVQTSGEDVLEIVKRWQTVPENIKSQINDLYVNVQQEDFCQKGIVPMTLQGRYSHFSHAIQKTEKKTSKVSKKTCISETNSGGFKRRKRQPKSKKRKENVNTELGADYLV